MMGLTEGSEAEEQFHINMAKKIYCGESVGTKGNHQTRNTDNIPINAVGILA